MNGADLLMIVLVVVGALYVARRLDEWEEERELDWLWERALRRAGEALDGTLTERGEGLVSHEECGLPRSVSVFDQERDIA